MGELEAELARWLPRQRWFAGKARPADEVRVVGDRGIPGGRHLIVAVRHAGRWGVYQAPVLVDGGLHDALESREVVRAMVSGADAQWYGPEPPVLASRLLGVDQSNTSVVVDGTELVKFFRQVRPGDNPDVEVHAALRRLGSRDVVELRGRILGRWTDPGSGEQVAGDLGMMLRFHPEAVGGWELARTGAPMAGPFRVLGESTARVHRDLARAFPTARVDAGEVIDRIGRRIAAAADEVAVLQPLVPRLMARLADAECPAVDVQRVHGDLHLGQAMFTNGRWLLSDFEGEPGGDPHPLDSPLRDVAGMLRSFDYMAAFAPEEASRWRGEYARAFLAGYVAAGGCDPAMRPGLLDAYLVDKAVYEVVYESRNRPDWVGIPLAAVRAMAR